MNAKKAAEWIAAHQYCEKTPSTPRILAEVAAEKYRVALRAATPPRFGMRLPKGIKKPTPIQKLKKELDRLFSIFIRTRDANEVGIGRCITCGYLAHWKEMDCGHYRPRQDLATRWEEKNTAIQCKSCNGFRGGEPEKFAKWIDEEYGPGTAESLRAKARQPFKLQRSWLEMKITEYKGKIKE